MLEHGVREEGWSLFGKAVENGVTALEQVVVRRRTQIISLRICDVA